MKALALALVVSISAFAQEQVWTWVDEVGEEHFTNDKASIPEQFRAKATSTEGSELSVLQNREPLPSPGPATTSPRPPGRQAAIRLVLFEASTHSTSKALRLSGVLEKLVADNPGLLLERVELSSAAARAQKLNVTAAPTVLFLDPAGTERGRVTGLATVKELQAELDKARGRK